MGIIIAVDPGTKGGICIMKQDTITLLALSKLTWPDVAAHIFSTISYSGEFTFKAKAYIEDVHAMPKQGVTSTFKFGEAYGKLQGILTAYSIPFERVRPQVWQKAIGFKSKKGATKTEHKRGLKELAQELYPQQKLTNEVADALLIAEYARRKEGE